MNFKLHAPYKPTGDQPEAIRKLVEGIEKNYRNQVLLGATGTGKTFTIASVIESVQKPALVMAHNKTLAAQLYAEFKNFFPENANILSLIMTITNQRHTFPGTIFTSKKMRILTPKSNDCDWQPRPLLCPAKM